MIRLLAVAVLIAVAANRVHGDSHSTGCNVTELYDTDNEGECHSNGQAFRHTLTELVPPGVECDLVCSRLAESHVLTCTGNAWKPSPNVCQDRETEIAVMNIMKEVNKTCSLFGGGTSKPAPPPTHGLAKIQAPVALFFEASMTYRNFRCADIYIEVLIAKIEEAISQSTCVLNATCSGNYRLRGCENTIMFVKESNMILQITENVTFADGSLYKEEGLFKWDADARLQRWHDILKDLESFGDYLERIIKGGQFDVIIDGVTYAPDANLYYVSGEVLCASGMETKACICVHCPPGMYSHEGRCLPCKKNFYQDRPGQDTCVKCPLGTSTGILGAATRMKCVDPELQMKQYKDPIILCFIIVLVGLSLIISMMAVCIRKRKGKSSYSTKDVVISTEEHYYPPETEA